MTTQAAVMTGSGPGALATVQIQGEQALAVLKTIFRPQSGPALQDRVGQIRVGTLQSSQQTIDQVTLGQEGSQTWALHCHGNPLITEALMELLNQQGITLVTARDMIPILTQAQSGIAQEARQMLCQAQTLWGSRLLNHQIHDGLSRQVQDWQQESDVETIHSQCRDILNRSPWLHACLTGIRTVLIGPPNSGKSTLLNSLAGRSKAIVTDIAGTTRDTVEAEIVIEPLCLQLMDTAGLDFSLIDDLDQASQQRSLEALDRAELVLVVLDRSRDIEQLARLPLAQLGNKPTIILLNKSDLPPRLKPEDLPPSLQPAIDFCAQRPQETSRLLQAIQAALGLETLECNMPMAFTERQRACLRQCLRCRDLQALRQIITGLQESG